MPRRSDNISKPCTYRKLLKGDRRSTLGDLDPGYRGGQSYDQYHDLQRQIRDGASKQRCGGGVRIIRKRTPE